MVYTWRKELKQSGLTDDQISHKVKGKIKAFNKLETELHDEQQKLPSITDPTEKTEAEEWIQNAIDVLNSTNDELVGDVARLIKNAPIYAKNAANLQKNREAKEAGKKQTGAPAPAPAPAPANPAPGDPAPADPAPVDPAPAADPADPVKKKSTWGYWVAGAILAILGGAAAVKSLKK